MTVITKNPWGVDDVYENIIKLDFVAGRYVWLRAEDGTSTREAVSDLKEVRV